jgi:phosphoribosylcarboxyaminoimidazole (NCAIR) mutase
VALGKAGAINAALLAVQVLALSRTDLQKRLLEHKSRLIRKVDEGNKRLSAQRRTKS